MSASKPESQLEQLGATRNKYIRGLLIALMAGCVAIQLPVKSVRGQSWCSNVGEITKRLASGNPARIDSVGRCGLEALPALEKALQDKRPEVQTRALALLEGWGADAGETLPAIIEILETPPDPALLQPIALAVEAIAAGTLKRAYALEKSDREEIAKLEALVVQLEKAIAVLDKGQPNVEAATARDIRLVNRGLEERLQDLESGILYRIMEWVEENPWVWFPIAYIAAYLACFVLSPRWLLVWDEPIARFIEGLPVPTSFKLVPSTIVSILSFLRYHPRVLDAWVASHLSTARTRFANKTTVAERKVYVPVVPIAIDGQKQDEELDKEFTPANLQQHFQQKRNRLLIWGEGGAGKTSLACKIGQWGMDKRLCKFPMLPVLIEQELNLEVPEGKQPFTEAVRGQLTDLIGDKQPLSEKLLDCLLRERRILAIVDRFSEMSEETRQQVRPELAEFPANALVITSRLEEALGGATNTCLHPLRIEGNRIARFVDAYLQAKQKRHVLGDDDDYFDACKRLSRMADVRPVTVLLAKLYADQLVAAYQGETARGEKLPENVPDLMKQYIYNLNRSYAEAWKTPDVLRDAKVVAWCCLQPGYVPNRVKREDVLSALNCFSEAKDAESRLQHLENKLRLIQTLVPDNKLQFALDPLSEYLAALYVMERCGNEPERWNEFLKLLEQPDIDLEKARGFVLALRDCCEVDRDVRVPDEVLAELARKGGLDPEDIQRIRRQRQIAKAIRDLQDPEDRPRVKLALQRIVEWGGEAKQAAATLRELLENQTLAVELRVQVVEALGASDAEVAIPVLKSFWEDSQCDWQIRVRSSRVLRQLGVSIPPYTVTLREGKAEIRDFRPVESEIVQLPGDISLEMISIPGGKFWMGSVEGEGYDREKPQHEVEVAPFQMGKYPITQAQWQAVASHLPQVRRELRPNPSSFKGDDRPVEMVSWYEAVEFCDRLTQLTGREYRLPSEAEWEYACRAGTTTPFYFGETITTELANYNGSSTYDAGEPKGENRQETTPVGSFPPNDFGLYDMHGNVWEWCADHWHEHYEGAPSDGSIWLSSDESSRRIERGGSWIVNPRVCRSANRYGFQPGYRNSSLGFRLGCPAPRT